MIIRFVSYIIACQWFSVLWIVYQIHSTLVFFIRPGAWIFLSILLMGVLYLSRDLVVAEFGTEIGAIWEGALPIIIGDELAMITAPFQVEISAIVMLIGFAVVFSLFASILKPVISPLSAPVRPIPPTPPLIIPDTTVRAVPVSLSVSKRSGRALKGGLGDLTTTLPPRFQALISSGPPEGDGKRHPPPSQAPFTRPGGPSGPPHGSGAGQYAQPPQQPSPTRPAVPAARAPQAPPRRPAQPEHNPIVYPGGESAQRSASGRPTVPRPADPYTPQHDPER